MIRVQDIHQRFGDVELFAGLSFAVAGGESLVLVGPSGAGKTTLLRILAGLAAPDRGEVLIAERSLAGLSDRDRSRLRATKVGFVFQGDNLLPHLSVLRNVVLPSAFGGRAVPEAEARAALARVGLGGKADQLAATISGGEAQRVAVARAVVQRPELLLCDEPTGSLDLAAAEKVGDALLECARELRCALVVATHDVALAGRCDRRLGLGLVAGGAA